MSQATIKDVYQDEETRKVLEQVVEDRKIQFRDVRDLLGLDRQKARTTLGRLKDAHLIQEKGAPLEDFSMFYATAQGLEAVRNLRRLDNVKDRLKALY